MNAKSVLMNKGHKYLACMYLMQTRFENERLSTEAMSNGNVGSIRHFTAKINKAKKRLHSEFQAEYEEIYRLMTQQKKQPCDLNEMWIIQSFVNEGN